MTALLWIGSILLWLTLAAFIGRQRHLYRVRAERRYTEPGVSLLLGLTWPLWVGFLPLIGIYYFIQMPAPEDRRSKKLAALREERLDLQANIKKLETENAEIDALLAKIQGAS